MSDAAAQPAETAAPPAPPPAEHVPVVDRTSTAPPAHQGSGKRPHSVVTIEHGSVVATPAGREGRTREIASSSEPVRSFTEKQQQMLDNIDKHGDVRGAVGAAAAAPVVDAKAEPAKPVEAPAAKPDEKPADPAKAAPAPAPAPDPEVAARAERLAEHNKRLLAENEQLRGRTPEKLDERMTALDEIERGLTTDSIGSLRKLIALNAGIKDPASADVDRLLSGLYAEWTAHELKLQMDPAQRAAIGTDRNRLMIERDKREREAKEAKARETAAAEAQTQRDTGHIKELDGYLETAKHVEKYPLLMKLSRVIDKVSPGELLFYSVRRGVQAGEVDPKLGGEALFDHYSKEIEKHYATIHQAHRELIPAAPTSTAAPALAPVPTTDKQADAPDKGVRTITNASASVAPPAPPAKATSPAQTDSPDPFKRRPNESEPAFRTRVAKLRFPD